MDYKKRRLRPHHVRRPGCRQEESQLHLAECDIIREKFWKPIYDFMTEVRMQPENTAVFWITGTRSDGERADSEEMAIIILAWRSLYAETIKHHLENSEMKYVNAVFRTIQLTLSRVMAHGQHWRSWWVRQSEHKRTKIFPVAHREHRLIHLNPFAEYTISMQLIDAFEQARGDVYGD